MLLRTPSVPPIISARWLEERLDDVTLVDVRWFMDGTSPKAAYLEGHLPGAVFANLDDDLAAPGTPELGRHPLPSPSEFAQAMSRLGVADDALVVAYDQGHGGFAARLVWMLRVTGHEATLLDGGLAGWPGEVEGGQVVRPLAAFTAQPWPGEWLADVGDVLVRSAQGQGVVVDSRSGDRYRGESEPIDKRAGHVPGAINLPFADNLDAAGHFLDSGNLARRFAEAGVTDSDDVVVYCGSGVTACHNLLAMESVGIHARLYPGSWSQWSARAELPLATHS